MLQISCHLYIYLFFLLKIRWRGKKNPISLPPSPDLVLHLLMGRNLSGCAGVPLPPSPYLSFTRPVSNCFFPDAHPARPPLAGLCLLKADSPRCINRERRAEEPRRVEASLPLFVWMLLQRPGVEELRTSTDDTLGRRNVSFVLAQGSAAVTRRTSSNLKSI